VAISRPPRPAPEKVIKTDVFSDASRSATLQQSSAQIQTGGFGDPNGVSDQNTTNRQTLTVARLGTFDAPSGPQENHMGGSHGTSGTVGSAGFGETSVRPVAQETRTVQTSGFGEGVPKPAPRSTQLIQSKPVLQPVEIIYKPRPGYTENARRQKVEGEVLLDVVFAASGSLRVNRVVKGLGYGLDDLALAAAQHIQFHPARRDGQPYDCAALVHFVFELPK
jgi:TonB family protein